MSRKRFDALTRLLASASTRRAVLATLLGSGPVAVLAREESAASRRGDRRKKRRSKPGKRQRGGNRVDQAGVSSEANRCEPPRPSANLRSCNYNRRDLQGVDMRGSTLTDATFRKTDLCGATITSAQLRNADFHNANLTKADLRSSVCTGTRFSAGTVFCRTIDCTGNLRNDDCPGTPEAEVCCTSDDCPGQLLCVDNRCVPCGDVCPDCPYTSVQAALDAGLTTITICGGTYPTSVIIRRDATLIGVGSGDNPAVDTILDGGVARRVLAVERGAKVEVQDLRIARGSVGNSQDGGGIHNRGTLTLRGVAVDRCRAGFGGGIDNEGTLDLIDSEITFNSAFGGAGIRGHRGLVTLLRTTVSANFAEGAGGGIAINRGDVTLKTGANVTGNTAGAGSGGGVANFIEGTLILEAGSSITSNEAPDTTPGRGRGGGIESAGTTRLEAGSSVTGNKAGGDGGGVFRSGGMVNVANTTIVTNNTVGGAVNNCRPSGKVNNCIG